MKTFVLNLLAVVVAVFILMNGHKPLDYGYIPSDVTLGQPTQFELWAEAIAEFESDGDPTVVNKWGMMGKYQFDPKTIEFLGFEETPDEFLLRPHLQDSVFVAYYRANKRELQALIDRYNGKKRDGFVITPAGILAGAHFAGAGGVRRYLEQSEITTDSNGTTVDYYMSRFADYDLGDVQ